jgi:hypothetical protein
MQYNGTVCQLFVDFEENYNSVTGEVLYNVLTVLVINKNTA